MNNYYLILSQTSVKNEACLVGHRGVLRWPSRRALLVIEAQVIFSFLHIHYYIYNRVRLLQASDSPCAEDDVACFGYFAELLLRLCPCCLSLCGEAVGMVSECLFAVCLAHLFVGCRLADAECSIGFLQGDIDVWLPFPLIFLIAREVVGRAVMEGEVDGGAAVHGVEDPSQQESEDEAATSVYVEADETKDPFIA